jgi:glycosyltransferase involved in cell wall biosynthesis
VQASESEGLPVVVLESMSYGVPPLVSDIPENLEAAHHAGFSFKNKDVDDLAKQLKYVLHHEDEVKEKGEEAQAVIETKFDWKHIADQIEGVYITARH